MLSYILAVLMIVFVVFALVQAEGSEKLSAVLRRADRAWELTVVLLLVQCTTRL